MTPAARRASTEPATLTPPRLESVVAMPDGRRLGIAEYGPSTGRPIIWFHGTPGGRHQIPEALRRSLHDQDARVLLDPGAAPGSSAAPR